MAKKINISNLILLITEIIILAFTWNHFYQDREVLHFTQEDMLLVLGENKEDVSQGFYVDSSYDGTLHQLKTPATSLPEGVYSVELYFQTGNPTGTGVTGCSSYADTTLAHPWVRSGRVRLLDYMTPMTSYRMWVDRDDTPVQVIAELTGDYDTWLLVRDVYITYYKGKTTVSHVLMMLLLFLLIDIPLLLWEKLPAAWKKRLHERRMSLLGILFIAAAASVPVFSNYIMYGYDTAFHINRIKSIAMGLESGYFPVRIQPGWLNGYGYASGVFYCDFFLYLPALLYLTGFTMTAVFHTYVFLMNLLTAGTAVLAFTRISRDRKIGVMAAAVYVLSLFRLGCVYTWCQIGTIGVMAFMPMVVYAMWLLYTGEESAGQQNHDHNEESLGLTPDPERKRAWIYLAIGMTGAVYSHVIAVLIMLVILVVFSLANHKKTFRKDTILQIGKAAGATVLLSLWYTVPFVDSYLNNDLITITAYRPFSLRQIQLAQIFSNSYETILDQRKYNAASSIQYNSILTFGMMAGLILMAGGALLVYEKKSKYRNVLLLSLSLAAACTILTTDLFPWKYLQSIPAMTAVFDRLEYPWRFMPFGTLFIAMTFLFSCMLLKEKKRKNLLLFMAVLCLITCVHGVQYENEYTHYAEQQIYSYDDDEVTMRELMGGEFRLKGQGDCLDSSIRVSDVESVEAEILSRKGLQIVSRITNHSESEQYVDFPLTGYYGYQVRADSGERLDVQTSADGRLRAILPPSYDGTVTADFSEPLWWRASEWVSLLSILCFAAAGMTGRRQRKKETK